MSSAPRRSPLPSRARRGRAPVPGGGRGSRSRAARSTPCCGARRWSPWLPRPCTKPWRCWPSRGPSQPSWARPLDVQIRPYERGEAAAYRLVVTATGDPDVDGAVYADAEEAGVWVNSADDTEHCTFMLPAVHRDGPVSVAVSTGGTSPALAGWLRGRVAPSSCRPMWANWPGSWAKPGNACRRTACRPSP